MKVNTYLLRKVKGKSSTSTIILRGVTMTNIMELTPDSEEWVGPKKLSGKHIEFVETYMRLTGSQKTLKIRLS